MCNCKRATRETEREGETPENARKSERESNTENIIKTICYQQEILKIYKQTNKKKKTKKVKEGTETYLHTFTNNFLNTTTHLNIIHKRTPSYRKHHILWHW